MKKRVSTALILVLATASYAEVLLPSVISSKMVLQRGVEAPIWGWADPGEEVTVTFAGQAHTAIPDAQGNWRVTLEPMAASLESREMVIRGKNEIILNDILVGEVWLASGQSNMEWGIGAIVPEEKAYAMAQQSNAYIRAFHVDVHVLASIPMDDVEGHWKSAAEMLTETPNVSAVAFFFALKLQEELGIPVAFLDVNWGGHRIEPFIPEEGATAVGLTVRSGIGALTDSKKAAEKLRWMAASILESADAADQGIKKAYSEYKVYGWGAPNFIHNAMIVPVTPYAIRGAIWYQGESNRGDVEYFHKLQALSAGWSQVFNVKDIPLYQVQIAPFSYNRTDDRDSTLCDNIWEAQYRAAKEIPGMGIVAIHDNDIDIKDIHPRKKRTVGERLAAQALKKQYGQNVVTAGPRVSRAVLNGATVVVSFSDIDQGLVTSDGQGPSWFELSEDGETFFMATAEIVGKDVHVRVTDVPAPKFVRMGWDDSAIPNLKDKNGWPVFAFNSLSVEP